MELTCSQHFCLLTFVAVQNREESCSVWDACFAQLWNYRNKEKSNASYLCLYHYLQEKAELQYLLLNTSLHFVAVGHTTEEGQSDRMACDIEVWMKLRGRTEFLPAGKNGAD